MANLHIKIAATLACLASLSSLCHGNEPVAKYLDPKVPVEQRIDDLLPRLTLEEKVIQLSDSWGSKGIPRLKIPTMFKTEGLHGQSYSTGATNFPQSIAMGTTFNPDLVRQVGQATALEAKSVGIRVTWSPVLDVARDARWGRVEETYGEDPFLVSRMGVAWISGFQGEGMIAVPKHFAGHGEPLGGRDSNDVGLSDRAMRNMHLPPFRAAIKEAHAGGVMAAYSTWNGIPDNGSGELLQKILREEWGFLGTVVSDCSGPENFISKQNVAETLEEACRMAILAGVDIECGSAYKKALASAVEKGVLRESDLDPNLRRVFRAKFSLGLFDHPASDKMIWDKVPAYDTPEHRALAREVAVQGSVLLKNDNKLLPLAKQIKTIAVIGPDADLAQTGDYSGKPAPGQLISVLDGVKNHVSAGTKVLFAHGCDLLTSSTSGFPEAVAAARQADAVILVVGDSSTREMKPDRPVEKATTGENNDGATLEIPGVQRQLIKEVQAAGKPVVLVLVNGKPFTLAWEAENIPAILETWYPGEEGGNATADLIFGDRNPSGRLPITFPRHVGQLPLHYNYYPSGRGYKYYDMPFSPLYRFGHGLSYTSFRYSNLVASPRKEDPGFVTVSVDVENTGERDGDEVAQLYVTDMLTSVITPVIQLEGIQRISLKKAEKKTVEFELNPYQLSLLNASMVRVLEPGKFRVHVGTVCPEPPLSNEEHKQKIGFKTPDQGISGEFEVPREYKADFVSDIKAPERARGGDAVPVTITVKNQGDLLDVAEIKLCGDTVLDTRRFEIAPGETQSHTFTIPLYRSGKQTLTAMVGGKLIHHAIEVSKVPAKLELGKEQSAIDQDGVLKYAASARNLGSEPYKGSIAIQVDGKAVLQQVLELAPGAQREIAMNYSFPRSGTFRVKIANAPEQQMVVKGGIGLALCDPLIYLTFDSADGSGVRNEVTGALLSFEGKPQFVSGKSGKAFKTDAKGTYVKAGCLDLYRKSFTLAAWILIESLDHKQATFFGGAAPMGANVDTKGTSLAASVFNEKLMLTFRDIDTQGAAKLALGKWVHLAFTYDADAAQGSVYINGSLDRSTPLKPYTGPLEMIGSAPELSHGKFAMDEALVTRSAMGRDAIKLLANKGIQGLRKGELTTDWRPLTGSIAELQTSADVPEGSSIDVVIEAGDATGKVVGSKCVSLKSGEQKIPVPQETALRGTQVRLRVQLASTKWNASPALQSIALPVGGNVLHWSTTGEWRKGSASGGVKIGL